MSTARIKQLLNQNPVGEDDLIVFLIVGRAREKARDVRGELMPDASNEHVLCPPFPPDLLTDFWLVGVAHALSSCAAFQDEQEAVDALQEAVNKPDSAHKYESIAVKAYIETEEGDSSGFLIRWEFLTDIAVHYFEPDGGHGGR